MNNPQKKDLFPRLPKTCCRVVGMNDKGLAFCSAPALYWYQHNEDICSYCEEHNYVCGEQILRPAKNKRKK